MAFDCCLFGITPTIDASPKITEIPSVNEGGTLILHAQKGFGKSVALRLLRETIFREMSIIHVNFSRTLSFFSAAKRGHDVYHYATDEKKSAIDREPLNHNLLEVVINSLPRVKRFYDVVVLDEAVSIMESLSSDLISPSHRISIIVKMMAILRSAKYVILADAAIEPYTAHMVKILRGKYTSLRYLKYTHQPNNGHACIMYHKLDKWFKEIEIALLHRKNIVIACMSVAMVKQCARNIRCKFPSLAVQVYYDGSKEDGEGDTVFAMRDVSIWTRANVLIYSPVITAGCSYEDVHFHTLFFYGLSSPYTGSVRSAIQMTSRIRDLSDHAIHVHISPPRSLTCDTLPPIILPEVISDSHCAALYVAVRCIDSFRKHTFIEKTTTFLESFQQHKLDSGYVLSWADTLDIKLPTLMATQQYTHHGQQLIKSRETKRYRIDALQLVCPSIISALHPGMPNIRDYVIASTPFIEIENEPITRQEQWVRFIGLSIAMYFEPNKRFVITWAPAFSTDEMKKEVSSWIDMFMRNTHLTLDTLNILWKLASVITFEKQIVSEKSYRDISKSSTFDRLKKRTAVRDIAIANSRMLRENEFKHSKHILQLGEINSAYVDDRDGTSVTIRYCWEHDPLLFGSIIQPGLILQLSTSYLWYVDDLKTIGDDDDKCLDIGDVTDDTTDDVADDTTDNTTDDKTIIIKKPNSGVKHAFPWSTIHVIDGTYCVGTFKATIETYTVFIMPTSGYKITKNSEQHVDYINFRNFINSIPSTDVVVCFGAWSKCALFEHTDLTLDSIYDLGLLLDCVILQDTNIESPFNNPERVFGNLVHYGPSLADAFLDVFLSDSISYLMLGFNLVSKIIDGGLPTVLECKYVCVNE